MTAVEVETVAPAVCIIAVTLQLSVRADNVVSSAVQMMLSIDSLLV